jgi:hypothetical protein
VLRRFFRRRRPVPEVAFRAPYARLADGDTVPVPGYAPYRDLLGEATGELPILDNPRLVRPYVHQRVPAQDRPVEPKSLPA